MKKISYYLFLVFLFVVQGSQESYAGIEQDREKVLLRKIGHEILLQSNDSTSLVRPILNEGDKYRIQFDANFGFQAENFAAIVDSIIRSSHFSKSYIVQIEACKSAEVVYSYEVDIYAPIPFLEELACLTRPQPEACYEVVIQFLPSEKTESAVGWIWFMMAIVLLLIVLYVVRKKKAKTQFDKNKIKLGDYLYDPNKMVLIRKEKTIVLTSKENELLSLLHDFANQTVTKEAILNRVWGDEGDYVGRTLDVYVSKLRKKLENDASIELKNIRGVGYKLIVEV
jgi:DNA-binding winged helix-turn-helix (wHTH) protein